MPFNPKLHQPEPDEESVSLAGDLPEDLALLGEELRLEAGRLAELYPAGESEVWRQNSGACDKGWKIGWLRSLTRVAAVAAIGLGVAWWWQPAHDPPRQPRQVPRRIAAPTRQPVETTADSRPAPSTVVPAAFFQELSSPEQEAILDLMERPGLSESSLSI